MRESQKKEAARKSTNGVRAKMRAAWVERKLTPVSEETKRKTSESLKKAYAEGRRKKK